jgi:hypothetical protein
VEEGHSGPRMEGDNEGGYALSAAFVQAMLQEFREQRLIHRRFAFEIVMQVWGLWGRWGVVVLGAAGLWGVVVVGVVWVWVWFGAGVWCGPGV